MISSPPHRWCWLSYWPRWLVTCSASSLMKMRCIPYLDVEPSAPYRRKWWGLSWCWCVIFLWRVFFAEAVWILWDLGLREKKGKMETLILNKFPSLLYKENANLPFSSGLWLDLNYQCSPESSKCSIKLSWMMFVSGLIENPLEVFTDHCHCFLWAKAIEQRKTTEYDGVWFDFWMTGLGFLYFGYHKMYTFRWWFLPSKDSN